MIVALPEDASWLEGECRGPSCQDSPTLRVIPVAEFQQLEHPWPGVPQIGTPVGIGLSESGRWVKFYRQAEGHTLVIEHRPGRNAVFLLPLLEARPSEVRSHLADGLARLGLPPELGDTFPITAMVCAGLRMKSAGGDSPEDWVSLAFRWAEEIDTTPDLERCLQHLADHGPTAKVRQRARELAQAKRVNGCV